MKAVIEIALRGSAFHTSRKQLKAAEAGRRYGADHHLDLLEALRRCGPCSVYALAKQVARNYSNVHTDVAKLEQHGLVRRTPEDAVFVPFESLELRLALTRKADVAALSARACDGWGLRSNLRSGRTSRTAATARELWFCRAPAAAIER